MAAIRIEPIRAAKKIGLNASPAREEYEAASQAVASGMTKGSPTKFSSGLLTGAFTSVSISSVSAPRVRAAASDPVLGFTAADGKNASSGATSKNSVEVALPGNVYEGNLFHTTAASTALAQAHLGATYGLRQHPSYNHWVIDLQAAASTDCIKIVGFKSELGDTFPRVYFTVRAAWRQIDS